eukprot:5060919-Amphidinium_carterae.1
MRAQLQQTSCSSAAQLVHSNSIQYMGQNNVVRHTGACSPFFVANVSKVRISGLQATGFRICIGFHMARQAS